MVYVTFYAAFRIFNDKKILANPSVLNEICEFDSVLLISFILVVLEVAFLPFTKPLTAVKVPLSLLKL